MSDKVSSRANLIRLLEVLWDYATSPIAPSTKNDFIKRWGDDFEERFNIQYPPEDLGINVQEEIQSTEHLS